MRLNAISFRTRCIAQGSLCDLIIDNGSKENIISKDVEERLQLETETHPSPFTIGWIKEVGGIRVNECCKVSFSIGEYNDEVYYDVVDMMLLIFYLGVLGSMMWILSTRARVTCINWRMGE